MKKSISKQVVILFCIIIFFSMLNNVSAKANDVVSSSTLETNNSWNSYSITEGVQNIYYKIALNSPGYLSINIRDFSIQRYSLMNEDLTKCYESKQCWGSEESPGSGEMKFFLEAGTYYINIEPYTVETGSGDIKANFKASNNNETEPNQTYKEAMTLTKGNNIIGLLTEDDGIDYYSIVVPKEQVITLKEISNTISAVTIYDSDLKQIFRKECWGNESDPGTLNEEFTWNEGTYYIKVDGMTYNKGSYELGYTSFDRVITIDLSSTNKSFYIGDTFTINPVILPDNAENKVLTWQSSNTSVATVSPKGVVKAIKVGTACITATSTDGGNISNSCTIDVKAPVLSLNKSKISLKKRQTSAIIVKKVAPATTLKFRSSNSKIATVSSSGVITAKKEGKCTITVKANGITKKIAITVIK